MDKKLKRKWLRALRSGKFKQLRGGWSDNGSYCCLGLLLAVNQEKLGESVAGNRFTCGQLIQDKDGLNTQKLINMNDGLHGERLRSFKQIANWIERNL